MQQGVPDLTKKRPLQETNKKPNASSSYSKKIKREKFVSADVVTSHQIELIFSKFGYEHIYPI